MSRKYEDKEFINVEEMAEILGISRSLAYDYVKSESCKFKCLKINRRYVIPTNSFYKWYDNLGNS